MGAKYQQLGEAIREAPFVHTDDTGWRIGGKAAFLMGFETDRAAIYQVRWQHRNEEVREIIPGDYGGVMISDRGKSYDAGEFDEVEQQKCLGHILRNIAEVVETKQGRAREFGVYAKVLLQDGMDCRRTGWIVAGRDGLLQDGMDCCRTGWIVAGRDGTVASAPVGGGGEMGVGEFGEGARGGRFMGNLAGVRPAAEPAHGGVIDEHFQQLAGVDEACKRPWPEKRGRWIAGLLPGGGCGSALAGICRPGPRRRRG